MENTFSAATWNVYHGTEPRVLKPILRQLLNADVTLFLVQEASDPRVRDMFVDADLKVAYQEPQYLIAHVPVVWDALNPGHGVRLSPTAYYGKGDSVRYSDAVVQRLEHIDTTKVLRVMSYHPPAHVQVQDPTPNRVKAAIESARKWREMAERTRADGILFGGDDNVDEGGAFMDRLRWFRDRFTGLHQVQAPSGTHGRRRIDDFRVKGIKPLQGYVTGGGGDHKVHVRKFAWL